jgi:hypothetical protein
VKYPCPCCGYLTFVEPPGEYEICPISFWEDDISQLRFPNLHGANHASLIEGQKNFVEFGACEKRVLQYVRKILARDEKDATWRPIDISREKFDVLISGKDYGSTYPSDSTQPYYWRRR